GPGPGQRLLQPSSALAVRPALGFVVVRPRAAEDPVVEPLAADAETLSRPVVGPATYPSTDVVMPARTFVIGSSSFRSAPKTNWANETHRDGTNRSATRSAGGRAARALGAVAREDPY